MQKIILYGAGKGLDLTFPLVDFEKSEVIAIIDGDPCKQGTTKYDISIIAPADAVALNYDWIIICSGKSVQIDMHKTLLEMGVKDTKIITTPAFSEVYDNEVRRRDTIALNAAIDRYVTTVDGIFKPGSMRGYRHFSVTDLIAEHERPLRITNFIEVASNDYVGYVRLATLQLLAEQVVKNNVFGDMAELGVHRGWFAAPMNELLPDRKLHLFDTFEGFTKEDIDFEKNNGYLMSINTEAGAFSDTSVDYVLSKMKAPQNCVVHKGYFPDTANEIPDDIRYCLVSIDADIYKPIYAGLYYFYEKLSPGGYIMVHDYNQMNKWAGATEAVDRFCMERKLCFVPIPDECGSVVFTKF